jgi:inositol-1,3,4-trisphosphate 5/6-kinase/inositol-tetrakisphosphate 1-kinase
VKGDPASIPSIVEKAGLKLPLGSWQFGLTSVFLLKFKLNIYLYHHPFSVVKPLVVDGSAQSHVLYLAYDELCLTELHPPVVLQEFVNHGKVLAFHTFFSP